MRPFQRTFYVKFSHWKVNLGVFQKSAGRCPGLKCPRARKISKIQYHPAAASVYTTYCFRFILARKKAILVRVLDTQASGGQMRGADGLAGAGAPSTRSPSMRTVSEANKANA